eukprot:2978837-Rhodomonas_salina.2
MAGASGGTDSGQPVQHEALQFVTGPQTTQSFEILPGLRRDQYLAPMILLQMDALRIRHRHRNGQEKLDRMLELFIARLKHLSGNLATAGADDRDEFDVESQLLCAERWIRSVVRGEPAREAIPDRAAGRPVADVENDYVGGHPARPAHVAQRAWRR